MGLDSVELVMEVEETFAIAISDDEAGGIVTVGQLFEHVVAKTAAKRQQACLSRFSFYRLRTALIAVAGARRAELRPRTDLANLLPERSRRRIWRRLAGEANLRLPHLTRSTWLTRLLTALALGIAGHCFWLSWPPFGLSRAAALACMVFVVAAIGLERLSSPWATHIDSSWATLGGLTTAAMARNYAALSADQYQGTRAEIWSTLVALISEQLGVGPEEITLGARFVHDLGVD
jgi:hypothetical protein